MALNAKQKLFIQAYLVERSATQAVLAAGLTKKPSSARVMGTRLLAQVSIRDAIQKLIDAQAARLEIKSDRVLKDIAVIAHDPFAKKFERLKALELLGKHFKIFTEVHEHGGNMPGVQVILTMPTNGSEAKESPAKKEKK